MVIAYILADGACSYDDPAVLSLNKKMSYVCPYLPLLLTSRCMREDVRVAARRVERGMDPVIDVQVANCEALYASWLRMPFFGAGGTGKGKEEGVVIECLTIRVRFCKRSAMTYKLDQTELILRKLIRRITREGPSPYMRALHGGSAARVKRLVIELQTTANAARYKSISRKVPLARTLHLAWSEGGRGGDERDLGDVERIAIRIDGKDFYTVKYRG
ncbi:hypothetical protein DM02DRAFT_618738 [Periconia macrospinosa]|uniref:Uncharacterized protein n=1 Tax=Periconia macrospinosa TaxID=97972 RepID=A0A2V1D817_9PLEO|nr:hypothetical protein DM02DRAFT_618738 [Periconia macrospinosa]